ncbi:hypothetical protein OAG63_01480 [Methylacidiphilales bacterium]|nr:hypothetical protein [Candidatus Methylacidiphilales bacterium]
MLWEVVALLASGSNVGKGCDFPNYVEANFSKVRLDGKMNQLPKHIPDCPQTGWQWLRAVDSHDDPSVKPGKNKRCEFCKEEKLRFVHYIRHPDWNRTLAVGRKCARLLSGDPKVETSEKQLRDHAQRRMEFIHHKDWRELAQGNYWIEYQNHHIIVVRYHHGQFKLRINGVVGKLFFKNAVAAMGKAFDIIESGRHK